MGKHLDTIEDPGIRELLASMLERNPANRKSAEIYLAQARGTLFPEYFYSFLQSYMLIFSAAPILSPDEKINRLKKDIGNIINILKAEETDKMKSSARAAKATKGSQYENNIESSKDDSAHSDENTIIEGDSDQSFDKSDLNQVDAKTASTEHSKSDSQTNQRSENGSPEEQKHGLDVESERKFSSPEPLEGLVSITQLVTSCIRGLHHSQSKLQSLEILLELAENASDETILDRILPYIVSILISSVNTAGVKLT